MEVNARKVFVVLCGETSQNDEQLCGICKSLSLHEMRSTDHNHLLMQRHQPSYLALKRSALEGCKLCNFIWTALSHDESNGDHGFLALSHVSEKYPGKAVYLDAAGDGPDGWLDRIRVVSDWEIPEVSDEEYERGITDPTMHPEHQVSLSGVLDIFAYAGRPNQFMTRRE